MLFYTFAIALIFAPGVRALLGTDQIARNFACPWILGFGKELEQHQGPKEIELFPSGKKLTVHDIPAWKLENESAVYSMPGDDRLRPLIYFAGSLSNDYGSMDDWYADFSGMWDTLPTLYTMQYGGRGKTKEAKVIANAVSLIEKVYQKHKQVPILFGRCMGAAIAIAAVGILAEKYKFPALVFLDPMTSIPDTINDFWYSWVVGQDYRDKGSNMWYSDRRIRKTPRRVFDRIPLIMFSSTKDQYVTPEQHNQVFAQLCSDWEVAPRVTRNAFKLTEPSNELGVPKLLVEVPTRHCGCAHYILRQGLLNQKGQGQVWMKDNTLDRRKVAYVKDFLKRYILNGEKYTPRQKYMHVPKWIPSRTVKRWVAVSDSDTSWEIKIFFLLLVTFAISGILLYCLYALFHKTKRSYKGYKNGKHRRKQHRMMNSARPHRDSWRGLEEGHYRKRRKRR